MPHPAPNPVHALFSEEVRAVLSGLVPEAAHFLKAQGFSGKAGALVVLPEAGPDGPRLKAWFGLGPRDGYNPFVFRTLGGSLPEGVWQVQPIEGLSASERADMHLGFALGTYRFDAYRTPPEGLIAQAPRLARDGLTSQDGAAVDLAVKAHQRARDMINIPAQDMGPQHMDLIASDIAASHGGVYRCTVGHDLLEAHYPAIHAVGRAASAGREPRLIEIDWQGAKDGPVVVLIGKGVSFDTGGLDLKGASGMALMKKDMGGAAHALALGEWIMAANLPVRLHIIVAAVENSVSGEAFRPGDILASRAGISIEVGNTDAEGRLILADALTRAGEHMPDLTLDFATLTGAARVALGPQVVPFYSDDDALVENIEEASRLRSDPVWRLPLWPGYEDALSSDIADIRNDPQSWAQAGSVTAALFLKRFAPKTGAWAHFDIYGWNPRSRAGFPVGAEAQGLRTAFAVITGRLT